MLLAALTAYGALRGVRDWLRAPAAVLAAIPYLGAAYLAQGAFKEPMLGLALLGFALCAAAALERTRRLVSTSATGRGWSGQARWRSRPG